MPFGDMGGGGLGKALGSAVAKTTKKTANKPSVRKSSSRSSSSSGRSVGRTVARTVNRGSGGGGGSSGGSRGGGGGTRSIQPAPKPSAPGLAAYLGGDAAYQNVVRGGKRSLADFLSEMGRRRGEATTSFNQTKASMERDRVQQLEDLKNEFASRGLIQSGLYADEQGRFQKQFSEQQTALGQQQAALLADLLSQQTNFKREQDLALEAAKQEAIARRAAKYGLG